MAQPLIYGAVGPKGGDYLLEFFYSFDSYTLRSPFNVLGGTAAGALSEAFSRVADYLLYAYQVGSATYTFAQNIGTVIPFFADGVEIEMRYAGGAGSYNVRVDLRPNGDFYLDVYEGVHAAGPDGELVMRITCTPTSMKIYANDVQVHEVDPQTFDWDWVGPQPHYWMHLQVGLPFSRYMPYGGLVSIDDNRYFFQASRVPHIRAISYSPPRSAAAAFFRDFVKSYEIVGEGSSVGPTDPTDPIDPPDDTGDDTVLMISAPPTSPIAVESLPFRAVIGYSIGSAGGNNAPFVAFLMTLAAGTYKFSTALSPDKVEHDTQIALYTLGIDAPVYVNDDISDAASDDYRSEITATLPAGDHAIIVSTYGAEFKADGSFDHSNAITIPPGTVLRISKV